MKPVGTNRKQIAVGLAVLGVSLLAFAAFGNADVLDVGTSIAIIVAGIVAVATGPQNKGLRLSCWTSGTFSLVCLY